MTDHGHREDRRHFTLRQSETAQQRQYNDGDAMDRVLDAEMGPFRNRTVLTCVALGADLLCYVMRYAKVV